MEGHTRNNGLSRIFSYPTWGVGIILSVSGIGTNPGDTAQVVIGCVKVEMYFLFPYEYVSRVKLVCIRTGSSMGNVNGRSLLVSPW